MIPRLLHVLLGLAAVPLAGASAAHPISEPRKVSGIYPHLAMFNNEGECGTGAVVPWADRLWVVTYAPHSPMGSSDKFYEITSDLNQIVRPESIGGTPANRMIHRESQQLFIGPYVVDAGRRVRVIPYEKMFGRPTGNARHLTDPAGKIYYATMEEGLYEVDVRTLAVTELWADEAKKEGRHADLPGYHGKGLFSGQGRIVYANNGDHAREALSNPRVASGVLAEWDGRQTGWSIVRRNQFTEVTGPGGIYGNSRAETDPIWSIGWDHRSLILMLLDRGTWHAFRLPKASHGYDGAHGWNTEWPRIRDVGEKDLLMTMHGMFWRFPRTFSADNTAGIRPRSAYLKVIGDFCRWNDRLVFGCDDTTRSAFLNKRKISGGIAGAGQSQSNLWFTSPETPDQLGPTLASGAVWLREAVGTGEVSDPFLFAGWQRRAAHFVNGGDRPMSFALECDANGTGEWKQWRTVTVPPGRAEWVEFGDNENGEWVRVRAMADCSAATAHFTLGNRESRGSRADAIFDGLADIHDTTPVVAGLVRTHGDDKRSLQFAAVRLADRSLDDVGTYEVDGSLQLQAIDDGASQRWLKANVAIARELVTIDPGSVLVIDEQGRRWRLPRGDAAYDEPTRSAELRVCREVATERDLLNVHGTFYELPADNAGGFARLRPVSSHTLRVMDYCSYRGLLVLSGVRQDEAANEHIVRSADGRAALWVGAIDDLWKLGKPVGAGGPWLDTPVQRGEPSDPYLFWGYDERRLTLRADRPVEISVEVDLDGESLWVTHRKFRVTPDEPVSYSFPSAFQARWIRFTAGNDCSASARLEYR